MKMLVLAVVLAVMQATPPVPGKTPDNAAGGSSNIKSQSATDKNPTTKSLAPDKPTQSPTPNGDGRQEGQHNAGNPIRISEFPPVSVTKDWADWGVWIFSAILTIVGFLQVGLLYYTLKVIRRQADWMKRQTVILVAYNKATRDAADAATNSAEAANKSIRLVISKERARLTLEAKPLNLPSAGNFFIPHVEYQIRLYGPTDAIIRATVADAIITESEEPTDETPLSSLAIPGIISPSESPLKGYQLITTNSDIEGDIQAIKDGAKFVHFWGMILYDDVFKNHYYTNFRLVWNYMPGVTGQGGTRIGRWYKCGKEEDNKAI